MYVSGDFRVASIVRQGGRPAMRFGRASSVAVGRGWVWSLLACISVQCNDRIE